MRKRDRRLAYCICLVTQTIVTVHMVDLYVGIKESVQLGLGAIVVAFFIVYALFVLLEIICLE